MKFDITPDVHVRRDQEGKIRQLRHLQQPYTAEAASLAAAGAVTPRALAEQYLRDVAKVYDMPATATANFTAAPSTHATQDPTQLRFQEEKSVENNTTVSYAQTLYGLPVWDAGVTVRLNTTPLQVTSSHNAMHDVVGDLERPEPEAAFLPNRIEPAKLKQVLGLTANDPAPRVTATRLLIYRYEPDRRADPQIKENEDSGGLQPPDFPYLPLPAVPQKFTAGKHYIVTEVLFTLPYKKWGELNWRAFLDPDTGTVLYLRALVACAASGQVFPSDPATLTGKAYGAATAPGVLDPLRQKLTLLGLNPVAAPPDPQELTGSFVRLQDVDPPATIMPKQLNPYEFNYSCPASDFAAVSAYYHCDWAYRFVQGLGIDPQQYFSGTSFPVPVDPQALNLDVNAQARGNAAGNGMGAFVFGNAQNGQTMGIAADVRVVLHEFGHALLWDHVSSPNFGFAHSAGDSLGAILHDPDTKLTGADRFETFPFMKNSSGLSRRHDRDVALGWSWFGPRYNTQYQGEQVLSTTLFRIYRAAGGDSTNVAVRRFTARYTVYLIIKAIGALAFTTLDPDVYVTTLIEADQGTVNFEGLAGGTMGKLIRWSFEKQGLYQPPGAPNPILQPGAPPDVDVYVDDGRHGEYMPFLATFDNTPATALWNRQAADGAAGDQAPVIGAPNFLYVIVRNRGTQPAQNVTVKAYQSKVDAPVTFPVHWKAVTAAAVAVPNPIPSGGSVTAGPIEWTPSFAGQSVVVSVSADGDRSHADTVMAAVPNDRLVPLDNNIVQRKF